MSTKIAAIKEAKVKILAKMRKFAAGTSASVVPPNPKAKKIAELAVQIGGCQKPKLIALLEELTGLPISKYTPKEDMDIEHIYEKGMLVVPMTDDNEQYVKGSPALVYFENCAVHFTEDGKVVSGARLDEVEEFSRNTIRLATPAEANKFFDHLMRVAEDTEWVELDKVIRATK